MKVVDAPPGGEPPDRGNVTLLLAAAGAGDRDAHAQLFRLVYADLRRLASWRLSRAKSGDTLSPTVLVHEVYLRFADPAALGQRDRQHFFAVAASAMRQILIDHARRKQALKRGAGEGEGELVESALAAPQRPGELLALDAALDRLAVLDGRLARVVEWHYFGGYSFAEIGAALELTERTVARDWAKARALLRHELAAQGIHG